MKIDATTLTVLKNFAKINPSIVIQEGNTLKTISPSKTIMAKANITTQFDKRFAIYNLDRFLSTLSLFTDPELTFNEQNVTVSDANNKKINYFYADENTVTKVPEKELSLPRVDVEFNLTTDNLRDVERALGILSLPDIVISGDGVKVYLQAADTKNPGSDVYSIEIGDTDKNFKVIFKCENIRVLPGNYKVSICSAPTISHFVGESAEYFIAVEKGSTFS
jgi:Leucine-rich repeat (LRR) protein